MTETSASESQILAYVYDELSSVERRAFEEKMASEPNLRAEVDGLLATRTWLGADARFGQDRGLDIPPPHLVDAIVQAEAIARSASVREALQQAPGVAGSDDRGWLGRLNQWMLGGGIAVAATLAFLVSNKTPEHDEPPAMESMMQASERAGGAAKEAKSDREAEPQKAASTGAVPAAPAPMATMAKDVAEAEDAAPPSDDGRKEKGQVADEGIAKAKRSPSAKVGLPGSGMRELEAAMDSAPSSPEAESAAADLLGGFGAGLEVFEGERAGIGAGPSRGDTPRGASRGAAFDNAAPSLGARAMPPVPKAAARAQAEKKRLRTKDISPEQQERLQLRENLRRQEAQSDAQMTLASAGIALQEERYAEALELFIRASHEDRATKSLGAAPFIGQMRALLALQRFQQALDLFPELKRRTRGQSEDRALAHWFAGQAAERLGRLAEAKSHYRFAARNHASLQAQAQAAFQRVSNAESAAKNASSASSAPSAASESSPAEPSTP